MAETAPLPYPIRQMNPETVKAMIQKDPQSRQILTDKPRVGFSHNPYLSGLGKLFQNTVKNTLLEKLIDQVWQGFVRYRAHGDNKVYREALKEPEKLFVYDDPFLSFINTEIKAAIKEYNTDNDAERKQHIQNMLSDIFMTMVFEDIYYRARFKLTLQKMQGEIEKNPDLLKLTNHEMHNYLHFSGFNPITGFHEPEKLKRIAPLRQLIREGHGAEYFDERCLEHG